MSCYSCNKELKKFMKKICKFCGNKCCSECAFTEELSKTRVGKRFCANCCGVLVESIKIDEHENLYRTLPDSIKIGEIPIAITEEQIAFWENFGDRNVRYSQIENVCEPVIGGKNERNEREGIQYKVPGDLKKGIFGEKEEKKEGYLEESEYFGYYGGQYLYDDINRFSVYEQSPDYGQGYSGLEGVYNSGFQNNPGQPIINNSNNSSNNVGVNLHPANPVVFNSPYQNVPIPENLSYNDIENSTLLYYKAFSSGKNSNSQNMPNNFPPVLPQNMPNNLPPAPPQIIPNILPPVLSQTPPPIYQVSPAQNSYPQYIPNNSSVSPQILPPILHIPPQPVLASPQYIPSNSSVSPQILPPILHIPPQPMLASPTQNFYPPLQGLASFPNSNNSNTFINQRENKNPAPAVLPSNIYEFKPPSNPSNQAPILANNHNTSSGSNFKYPVRVQYPSINSNLSVHQSDPLKYSSPSGSTEEPQKITSRNPSVFQPPSLTSNPLVEYSNNPPVLLPTSNQVKQPSVVPSNNPSVIIEPSNPTKQPSVLPFNPPVFLLPNDPTKQPSVVPSKNPSILLPSNNSKQPSVALPNNPNDHLVLSSFSQVRSSNLRQSVYRPIIIKNEDPRSLFTLNKKIGTGSMGQIYLATNISSQNPFAAKVIIPASDYERVLILTEFELTMNSHHPNIIIYHEMYEFNKEIWIIEDLMFCSLADIVLDRPGEIPENIISYVIKEILKGLDYLHSRNRIHRDIKSDNILISANGDIKIGDLGFVAQVSPSQPKRQTFAGTLLWMAPEIMGQAEYDFKVDIWSLGIIAYEIATGEPPYYTEGQQKIISNVLNLDSPAPPEGFSKDFSVFLSSCLSKNPRFRPSASELLEYPFIKSACQESEIKQFFEDWKINR